MKRALTIAAFGTGILFANATVGAQEKLFALQVLEDQFDREFEESIAGLKAKYRQALEKLKADYLKAGDLDSTLAVKDEISRLDAVDSISGESPSRPDAPPPPAVTAAEGGAFLLKPAGAVVGGSVRNDSTHALLTDWKTGGFAEWPLADVARGSYKITLNFHSGPFAGGRVKLEAGASNGELEITGSGKWDELKTLDLGKVSVTTGAERLRLTVLEARIQGVMELVDVTLTPDAEAPAPPVRGPFEGSAEPAPSGE